jgi:hypothetical protein
MRPSLLLLALLVFLPVGADGAVLCGRYRSDGTLRPTLRLRDVCRLRETAVNCEDVVPTTSTTTSTTTTTQPLGLAGTWQLTDVAGGGCGMPDVNGVTMTLVEQVGPYPHIVRATDDHWVDVSDPAAQLTGWLGLTYGGLTGVLGASVVIPVANDVWDVVIVELDILDGSGTVNGYVTHTVGSCFPSSVLQSISTAPARRRLAAMWASPPDSCACRSRDPAGAPSSSAAAASMVQEAGPASSSPRPARKARGAPVPCAAASKLRPQ